MSCPHCDDTGWKTIEEGGIRRVRRCECRREGLVAKMLAEARIPRRYEHCSLDRFETYENPTLLRAVAKTRQFVADFPDSGQRGLFFLGPPGVGKTHLAVAALKQVIHKCAARALFYDTRDLLKIIRSTYNPIVRTTELEIVRPVMDAELLVLDDIGAEKTSEWVHETLNLIVNTRYNERRLTLFTSNYPDSPDDTDPNSLTFRIGVRLRSRLHEMCEFLDLDGADYRELQRNEGPEALKRNWEERKRGLRRVQAPRQAKAQLREEKTELKWPGGRAGS